MAVNDIPNLNQNNQTNRNAENINRERRQEERQETRREPNIDRRQSNNNGVLLACSMLAGASMSRNNMLVINQQETQTRNFATEFIPSAIQIFETATHNIASGQEVIFSNNDINTGVSYTYSGGNSIEIIANGIYQISFVANVSGTANGQTANFAIDINGSPVTTSEIIQSVDNNLVYNIQTQYITKVTTAPATVSVLNIGADTIEVLNATLQITKISN